MSRADGIRRLRAVAYYLLVPGMLVFDWVVFRFLFGTDYVAWYLANGALIGVGTAFVSGIWEAVDDLGRPLVSADPLAYYSACLGAAGTFALVGGTAVKTATPDGRSPGERFRLDAVVRPLDELSNLLVTIAVVGLVLGWLLFVAPANYVVTLVSGAPARMYLRSPHKRLLGVVEGNTPGRDGRLLPDRDAVATLSLGPSRDLSLYETGTGAHRPLSTAESRAISGEEATGRVVDLTLGRKPFATTQAITGLVLFVVGRVV
jgi:hypothetical protein